VDKLTSIRAFTKVVQHSSFAAAARDLRLSRSAVSKYVMELEEELGVQLLSRTTRSVTPTENGQAYTSAASRIPRFRSTRSIPKRGIFR
jgi:DNA-binding transcriptional LysR family regulator